MFENCSLAINPATRSDIIAACIQAEAAVTAGKLQADAATSAGWMTLAAGLLAVLAAIVTAYVAVYISRRQQTHTLKGDIYTRCVEAFSAGLDVIVRISNLDVARGELFKSYEAEVPKIFAAHLAADMETGQSILNAVEAMGSVHQTLAGQRPAISSLIGREARIGWARMCAGQLTELVPPMVKMIANMRGELGLYTDQPKYEAMVLESMARVISKGEKTLTEMLKDAYRAQRAKPPQTHPGTS